MLDSSFVIFRKKLNLNQSLKTKYKYYLYLVFNLFLVPIQVKQKKTLLHSIQYFLLFLMMHKFLLFFEMRKSCFPGLIYKAKIYYLKVLYCFETKSRFFKVSPKPEEATMNKLLRGPVLEALVNNLDAVSWVCKSSVTKHTFSPLLCQFL